MNVLVAGCAATSDGKDVGRANDELITVEGRVQTFSSTSGIQSTLEITEDDGVRYCGKGTVTNTHSSKIAHTWNVELAVDPSTTLVSATGGRFTKAVDSYKVSSVSTNSVLAPRNSATFSFCATRLSTAPVAYINVVKSDLPVASGPGWELGNYRLMSPSNRDTLTDSSLGLLGHTYRGALSQQWHFAPSANGKFRISRADKRGETCLDADSQLGIVASVPCGSSSANWEIVVKREATTKAPGRYQLRHSATQKCLTPNALQSPDYPTMVMVGALAPCNATNELYVEASGWGARSYRPAVRFNILQIAKPELNADVTLREEGTSNQYEATLQSSMAEEILDANEAAFTDTLTEWIDNLTDGRIYWQATARRSSLPVTQLDCQYLKHTGDDASERAFRANCNPWLSNFLADFQQHTPIAGQYDSVFFFWQLDRAHITSSVPSPTVIDLEAYPGLGWPVEAGTQGATWGLIDQSSVYGGKATPEVWRSKTQAEPVVIYVHEFLEQVGGYYDRLGVPLPKWTEVSSVHGGELAHYSLGGADIGWNHWHRDYLLGTVIEDNDTYVGLGARAFAYGTPSSAARASR